MRAFALIHGQAGRQGGIRGQAKIGVGGAARKYSRNAASGRDLDIVADEITSTDVVGKLSWYFVEFLL
jgi:hypothetical protein